MSIVNLVGDRLPNSGSVVYCDNGIYASDRAIFEGGKFIGGGEFPVPSYEMKHVTKWFYLSEYHEGQTNKNGYNISFDIASTITTDGK